MRRRAHPLVEAGLWFLFAVTAAFAAGWAFNRLFPDYERTHQPQASQHYPGRGGR